MTNSLANIEQDIPIETARSAHYWSSFDPDRRADQDIKEYAADLRSDYSELEELCLNEEQQAILDNLFPTYREAYARLYRGHLVCQSRCASSAVTGSANFNFDRNRKRIESSMNKLNELIEFRKRTVARIRKQITYRNPVDQLSDDCQRFANLTKLLETMKAANKILRGKKPDMRDRLIALELKPETADALMTTPDCFGNIGFAPFDITSVRTKIKRLEEKINAAQLPVAPAETIEFTGGKIVKNPAIDRVQIIFPGKPDRAVIDRLKAAAFRWCPSNKAWQRHLTRNGIDAAMQFAS
jgi:hypothetical protein